MAVEAVRTYHNLNDLPFLMCEVHDQRCDIAIGHCSIKPLSKNLAEKSQCACQIIAFKTGHGIIFKLVL